jgi:hypothetical protein
VVNPISPPLRQHQLPAVLLATYDVNAFFIRSMEVKGLGSSYERLDTYISWIGTVILREETDSRVGGKGMALSVSRRRGKAGSYRFLK